MKKISIIISIFFIILSTSFVQAKNSNGQGGNDGQGGQQVQEQNPGVNNKANQGTGIGIQNREQSNTSPEATGNQFRNQNQVRTENQGEESQLQVRNQEQERNIVGTGSGVQNRNQKAYEYGSEVSRYVQQLLAIKTTGGLGEQVRQVARAQNQAQTEIEENLDRLDAKGKIARLLTGTDLGAVKNLKQQVEKNNLRIEQLNKLQTQLSNQSDVQVVQETIQALLKENTALQERIDYEDQTKSMFGWMIKYFQK